MKKNILQKIIFIVLIITFILDFFFNKTGNYHMEPLMNVVYILLVCVLLFLGNINQNIEEKKKNFKYYLIFYIILIIYLTFNRYWHYQGNGYNLLPLNTILHIRGNNHLLNTLIVNFLLYMPLGFILINLNDKLKLFKNYIITIIFTSITIKTIGYIFGYSIFDIDDILLNILGSIVIFFVIKNDKINGLTNNIFYKIKFKESLRAKVYIIIYIIFIVISISKSFGGVISLYEKYHRDFSNFYCYKNNKTYITTLGNYKYYSKCEYKDSYIIAGTHKYSLSDYINSDYYQESDNNKLYIIKDKIIDNVKVYKKENIIKKISNANKMRNMYFADIDYITLTKNNINYKIEDDKDNDIDFHSLVNARYSEAIDYNEYWYILYKGDYFNIINIFYLNESPSYEFIIPNEFKINESSVARLYKYAKEKINNLDS